MERQEVVEGFLRSEDEYLKTLKNARELWAALCAISEAEPRVISTDAVNAIFYGILPLEVLHQNFFQSLMACDSQTSFAALLCSTFRSFAGPFTRYILCLDKSLELISRGTFKDRTMQQVCKGSSEALGAGSAMQVLLEPLWRILEYRKLARFLVEHTPASNVPDYADLLVALTLIEESTIPTQVVEDMRSIHIVHSMMAPPSYQKMSIQLMRLGRRVVKQGALMIWQEATSEWVQRHVLLLNDAWMCFSSSEAGLILEENASLTEVAVDVQSEQDATSSFEVVLLGDGGPRLTFLASSRPEKLEWSSTLRHTSAFASAAGHSQDFSRVTSEARLEVSAHLERQQGGGVIGGGRDSEQVLDDFERRLAIMEEAALMEAWKSRGGAEASKSKEYIDSSFGAFEVDAAQERESSRIQELDERLQRLTASLHSASNTSTYAHRDFVPLNSSVQSSSRAFQYQPTRRQFVALPATQVYAKAYAEKVNARGDGHTTGPILWAYSQHRQHPIHRQYIAPAPLIVERAPGSGPLFIKSGIATPRRDGMVGEPECTLACYQESVDLGMFRFVMDVNGVDDIISCRPAVLASLSIKRHFATRLGTSTIIAEPPQYETGEFWLQVPGHPPIASITLKHTTTKTVTAGDAGSNPLEIELRIMHDDYKNVAEDGEKLYSGLAYPPKKGGTCASVTLCGVTSKRPVLAICELDPFDSSKGRDKDKGWRIQVDYDYPLTCLIAFSVAAMASAPWWFEAGAKS